MKYTIVCICSLLLSLFNEPSLYAQTTVPANTRKIQVAVLLDVSNSMDGLIDQAKSQLWNMVTVLGKTRCGNQSPKIEIALYEYGRSTNSVAKGYIQQLSAFTSDLDKLSAILFNLKTNGGDEYCGTVIKASLDELQWDQSAGNYRVIFIAGNEDFRQGKVSFTEACRLAQEKGVIVNTIYCGDRAQGIRENWNLGAECGNGSYTNIDANAREEVIATPYDSMMYVLNSRLNATYIGYGERAEEAMAVQAEMDIANAQHSRKAGLERTAAKATRGYNASSWDLVDAYKADSTMIERIDVKQLPQQYRGKTKAEIKKLVEANARTRAGIQQEILRLNQQRNNFIATERKRRANANTATLETEIERIIRSQVQRFGMTVE